MTFYILIRLNYKYKYVKKNVQYLCTAACTVQWVWVTGGFDTTSPHYEKSLSILMVRKYSWGNVLSLLVSYTFFIFACLGDFRSGIELWSLKPLLFKTASHKEKKNCTNQVYYISLSDLYAAISMSLAIFLLSSILKSSHCSFICVRRSASLCRISSMAPWTTCTQFGGGGVRVRLNDKISPNHWSITDYDYINQCTRIPPTQQSHSRMQPSSSQPRPPAPCYVVQAQQAAFAALRPTETQKTCKICRSGGFWARASVWSVLILSGWKSWSSVKRHKTTKQKKIISKDRY